MNEERFLSVYELALCSVPPADFRRSRSGTACGALGFACGAPPQLLHDGRFARSRGASKSSSALGLALPAPAEVSAASKPSPKPRPPPRDRRTTKPFCRCPAGETNLLWPMDCALGGGRPPGTSRQPVEYPLGPAAKQPSDTCAVWCRIFSVGKQGGYWQVLAYL